MPLEVPAGRDDGHVEQAQRAQLVEDERAADASVAVPERVHRLELVVRERHLRQQRYVIPLAVHESLERRHAARDRLTIDRRHEARPIGPARRADVHRHVTELARAQLLAAYALEQFLVHLADECGAVGLAALDAELHRAHGIKCLASGVGLAALFPREHHVQRGGADALDLRAQPRLAQPERLTQDLGIRHGVHQPVHPAQGRVGAGKLLEQLALDGLPIEPRRQVIGHEGPSLHVLPLATARRPHRGLAHGHGDKPARACVREPGFQVPRRI